MQGNQTGPTATQSLVLEELQGRKVEKGKKVCEKGSHPQLLYSSRFYPFSWLWGVLCKKDLGPIRNNSKCQMEMMCVLLLRLFHIRRALWASTRKKRDKTLIF